MSQYVFKLPDLGEGTVEAEIGSWHVKAGDVVKEDDVIVDMMTDKAAVEVPSPVNGTVVSITGEAGDIVAVGAALIVFETDADVSTESATAVEAEQSAEVAEPEGQPQTDTASISSPTINSESQAKTLTSPSIRRRAREAGIDLAQVPGNGPKGRILRSDLEDYLNHSPTASESPMQQKLTGTEEIKVIGLRRIIANRMSASKREIPHFSYIEEVDITELDELRKHLNSRLLTGQTKLTYLPFILTACIRSLKRFPQCNAVYDSERNVIVRHQAVHAGIATQTPDGLKVPVVKHAESLSLWQLASEMNRVSTAARDNTASKQELSGSTITITSLGKLGGIASTPVINAPEVGIIGLNRAAQRPMVYNGSIQVRLMMNISASFDHRFVDGYDAAEMIQSLKEMLEYPSTMFIPN